jgi:phage shock protein PspC (stress-responsive transcriptional regulator)
VERRLYKSETDSMVAGVCGGLAEYLDVDPVLVRLAFVLLIFAGGIGVIAYIALWIIMPKEERVGAPTEEVIRENVEDIGDRARELGEDVRSAFEGESAGATEVRRPRRRQPSYVVGGVLIIIGLIFLMDTLHIFPSWWTIGRLWPLVIVFIGIALLLRRR